MASENLHATLAFVGNVSESTASCLEERAAKVPVEPFDLQLDRTGCFPRTGVLWLGAGQIPSALERMVRELNTALAPCGYAPDPRPLHLHITLFRKARPSPETPEAVDPIPWRVEGFSLIESVSIRGGVRYHPVRDYTH
jgi:2'-5' RNA ligase